MSEALPGRAGTATVALRLGTQSLIVLLGNMFTLAVGLPLQIYVSRVLGAKGLGAFGLIEGATLTIGGMLGLGIAATAVRFIPAHQHRKEFASIRRLIRLGATILASVGGAAYVLFLIVVSSGGASWPFLAEHRIATALMGLTIPLGLLLFFLQQALRGFQEIRFLVLGSSVVQLTVKVVLTFAAFAFGLRVEGYILAIVLATLSAVIWMALGLRRRLSRLPHISGTEEGSNLEAWRRYASIIYSQSLIGAGVARLDRFVLGALVGTPAVGVLLVVQQLHQLPQVFNQMLLMTGAPMFAAAHSRNDAGERQHLYLVMTDWVVKAALPLILFLMQFAYPVLALFGPDFADAGSNALRVFVLGQAFNIACGPVSNVAAMSGLEALQLRLSIWNSVLLAMLLFVLTAPFGLVGVAAASAVANVTLNATTLIALRRRLGLRWRNRRFLGWLAPAAAAGAVGAAVMQFGTPLGAVMLAATLISMYTAFAAVLFLQGLNEDDRELLRHLASRLRGRPSDA